MDNKHTVNKVLIIIICILVVCIGVLIGYILLRNGKKEINNNLENNVIINNNDIDNVNDSVINKVTMVLNSDDSIKHLKENYGIDYKLRFHKGSVYDEVFVDYYYLNKIIGNGRITFKHGDDIDSYIDDTDFSRYKLYISKIRDISNGDYYFVALFENDMRSVIFNDNFDEFKSFKYYDQYISYNDDKPIFENSNLNYYIDNNYVYSIYKNCSDSSGKIFIYNSYIKNGVLFEDVYKEFTESEIIDEGGAC